MQTELEAKFLNADFKELRKRLKQCGAKCVQTMRLMCRVNYDYPDGRLQKIGGWVRVRDESNKITLSYKQLNDRTLHGTKEVSVEVSDFDKTQKFLESVGLTQKSYQETKRESRTLDGAEVELDEWPWAKPYVEIEGTAEEQLKTVCQKLGLDLATAVHGSVEIVYKAEFNMSDDEIDSWPEYKFEEVPDFFEKRRISS